MPRAKTGAAILKWRSADGKRVKDWYACVSYTDESGKRQQWTERAMNKTAARSRATEMLAELANETPASLRGREMTEKESSDLLESASQALAMVEGSKLVGGRISVRGRLRQPGRATRKNEAGGSGAGYLGS
jgi:hypothetical protein